MALKYRSTRHQYVQLEDHEFNKLLFKCDVPQGFILGSSLFLIYVNDITTVSDILSSIMFADDTNSFASDCSLTNLIDKQLLNLRNYRPGLK